MIEAWWDLLTFRVPWFVAVDENEGDCDAILFCLHVEPEVEFEFEFGVVVIGEVDEELVPDTLDRTGTLALGDGVGIEA